MEANKLNDGGSFGGGSIGLSGEGWKRFGCATLASRVSNGKYLSACQHDAAQGESRQTTET
jgi:hypothetical protein